jgi:hypothetical protein
MHTVWIKLTVLDGRAKDKEKSERRGSSSRSVLNVCGKGQAAGRADSKKMSPNSFAFRDGDLFSEWRYA